MPSWRVPLTPCFLGRPWRPARLRQHMRGSAPGFPWLLASTAFHLYHYLCAPGCRACSPAAAAAARPPARPPNSSLPHLQAAAPPPLLFVCRARLSPFPAPACFSVQAAATAFRPPASTHPLSHPPPHALLVPMPCAFSSAHPLSPCSPPRACTPWSVSERLSQCSNMLQPALPVALAPLPSNEPAAVPPRPIPVAGSND